MGVMDVMRTLWWMMTPWQSFLVGPVMGMSSYAGLLTSRCVSHLQVGLRDVGAKVSPQAVLKILLPACTADNHRLQAHMPAVHRAPVYHQEVQVLPTPLITASFPDATVALCA